MKLSYDKYECRFWLSLDVPLWLDRLFNPYYEVEPLHPTALAALLREDLELTRAFDEDFTDEVKLPLRRVHIVYDIMPGFLPPEG